MKTDRRVKYTRMMLKESLLELMKDRPINKITVKDICEAADVNRGTFYTHYKDPFDLLEQIENELFDDILASLENSFNIQNIPKLLAEIFEAIVKNSELCKVLFSDYGDKEFLHRIIYIAHEGSVAQWRKLCPKATKEQLERLYTFFASGSVAIIQHWIQNNMKEDPQELALFIEKISNNVLQSLQ
ncbi:MAG: TetR family transcriptional regulator [Neobacillus sp.]|nr:TetR family transcriptional regulator [Neobacillus sp.]